MVSPNDPKAHTLKAWSQCGALGKVGLSSLLLLAGPEVSRTALPQAPAMTLLHHRPKTAGTIDHGLILRNCEPK
jgi:hypothetical protein